MSARSFRLRIALVTETFPPEINGVAMTTGRLVDGLLARGHELRIARPRQAADDGPCSGPETLLVRGLPIPGYPGLRFGLPARGRLIRAWTTWRPDVVQIVTEGPLGASAAAAARQLGIPVVSEFHTNFHAYSRHYGFGWFERLVAWHLRRLHNRSRLTLVPSREMARRLEIEGYRHLSVVSRGVDAGLFHPARRCTELRRQWGAGDDTPVIAYVGRIAPEKNLPLVLKTFEAIRPHAPGARLVLVGDGPARRQLESGQPGLVFAGMRRGEDLARHYASADLFLFPSLTETFGNVILEALASGLPVIAYRMAAAAEHVRHGETGMLVQPGASAEFIRAAVDFLLKPDMLGRGREAAADSVAGQRWEQVVERLEAALHDAIGSHGVHSANPEAEGPTDNSSSLPAQEPRNTPVTQDA